MNRNDINRLMKDWRLNWRRKPFVTYIFLFIIGVMYLIMTIDGGSENIGTLLRYGANYNLFILANQWWRLITPVFLHIGTTHLLFNVIVIYFLGIQIENIIGHTRYFILLFLSTMMGNAASFATSQAISAGASTAIFGLFASTLVLAKFYPYQMSIQQLSKSYIILIVLNIAFGLFNPAVDNAGHIGGLIGGYLGMYAISAPNASNISKTKRVQLGVLFLLIFIGLIAMGIIRTRRQFPFI